MNTLFTTVSLLVSTVIAATTAGGEVVALEAVKSGSARDTALVVFTKEDGTLWMGLPSNFEASQLLLNSTTFTDTETGRALGVDQVTAALTLTNDTKSDFEVVNTKIHLFGNASAVACPTSSGIQLFWDEAVRCENGARVDLYPSHHVFQQKRHFLETSQPFITSHLFGVDLAKRGTVEIDDVKRIHWGPGAGNFHPYPYNPYNPSAHYEPHAPCCAPPTPPCKCQSGPHHYPHYPHYPKSECECHKKPHHHKPPCEEQKECHHPPCACDVMGKVVKKLQNSLLCTGPDCKGECRDSCKTECRDPKCYCQDPHYYQRYYPYHYYPGGTLPNYPRYVPYVGNE